MRSKAVRIRRAVAGDLDALVDLENSVFDYDRMSARQLRRHLHNPSAGIIVATATAALIGSVVLFFRKGSRVARLYSIAIARHARGRGYGEVLLKAAEREARRRAASWLRLEVKADNAGAQRLYERLGYRRFGIRRAYYDDGHDAFRYEKALHR
jgi:[ribosomal protein S18]-alanine N-acetyltransferase